MVSVSRRGVLATPAAISFAAAVGNPRAAAGPRSFTLRSVATDGYSFFGLFDGKESKLTALRRLTRSTFEVGETLRTFNSDEVAQRLVVNTGTIYVAGYTRMVSSRHEFEQGLEALDPVRAKQVGLENVPHRTIVVTELHERHSTWNAGPDPQERLDLDHLAPEAGISRILELRDSEVLLHHSATGSSPYASRATLFEISSGRIIDSVDYTSEGLGSKDPLPILLIGESSINRISAPRTSQRAQVGANTEVARSGLETALRQPNSLSSKVIRIGTNGQVLEEKRSTRLINAVPAEGTSTLSWARIDDTDRVTLLEWKDL